MTAILPGPVEEADRLLDAASREGAGLALLGGVAMRLHAPEVPAGDEHTVPLAELVLRAKVGEHKRWYELPDEVDR